MHHKLTLEYVYLPYTMDLRGELVFTNLVSRQIQEQHELSSVMTLEQDPDEREKPLLGSMSDENPKALLRHNVRSSP